jgi:site-specific DNA-cytosine methylase
MGYHVEEGIYSAAEAGASQQRERLFILAILADSDVRGKQQWKHAGVGRIEELDTYWPAQPGEPQHGWEHPRVIEDETKPCMGCTVNGYDFREDLLRMCGNAVVEQCAEIAFLDLLYKHFNN